jgi:hypothetical protein
MRKLLFICAAFVALGAIPGEASQKLVLGPGIYDAMAEQQIRCTRRGCRTLRPGCRIVKKITTGYRVSCKRRT